ncbi:hypothetical protein [Roseospira visakhapatnamensis]|uniref:Putative nucleic acid-binding Zn-ribbon protein n=1 Tax=Roseospira visakhapatnamensis TaxID=390880 RepID=A0A7W6WC11_9PROT|nr:hypothetical protein [Roseospira visakhapatnamensis]MBB4268112.1 putative nucleic acid-binding Zn-ribbon protein [Roseospira visakhapatnamensis]
MADLNLKIALAAIDNATAPLRRVREAARQMSGGARAAAERLGTLERSAEQLTAFRTLRAKTRQNTRALADLEDELTGAREKLARVTQETNGSGRAFQRATQHVAFLEKKEAGLIKRTHGLQKAMAHAGEALRDAGVDTEHASAETRRLSADMARATRHANALAGIEAHFDRIRRAAGGAALAAGAVSGRLSGLVGATGLGGLIGGGLASAGLGSMVQGFADAGREIDLWSRRLGVGATALQSLIAVGGRFGIEQDAMIDGLKELSLRADEFAAAGAGEGAEAFQRLGLTRDQLTATKGDTEALFELVRGEMEGIQDVAARQRIADELFGGAAAEQMVEMLTTSTDELRRMRAEAEASGQILPAEDIARARSLSDGLRRLTGQLSGLSKTIAARLAPVLTPLIRQLGDWIAANRDLIATQIGSVVERLTAALDRVDWSGVLEGLRAFGARVGRVVEAIGGWDNAIIAVIATMNAGLIGSVVTLGAKLVSLASSALPAVIGGVRALSAALMTNPILAVIGGIAFGAYAIYANWDRIGAWFTAKMDRVRAAFDRGLGSGLWTMLKELNPWRLIADAWDGLFDWLFGIDLSGLVSRWFGPVLGAAGGLAGALLAPLDAVRAAFDRGLGAGLWAALTKTSPWALVRGAWEGLFEWLFGIDLSGLADRLFAPVRQALDDMLAGFRNLLPDWALDSLGLGPSSDADDETPANPDAGAPPTRPTLPGRFASREPYADGRPSITRPANDDTPPVRIVETAPGVAAAAQAAGATTAVDSHDTYQITVHAPPGLDAQEVARLVRAELDARDADRRSAARAHLYDGVR